MSESIENNSPPAGERFTAYDADGYYSADGKVISAHGAGVLFCEMRGYDAQTIRRMVPPSESAGWHFFETHDEWLAAHPWRKRREA